MGEEPARPDPDALDPAAIGRLRRLGGDDLVGRMAALFADLGERRLAAAREGLDAGDLEAVERAAHSLKSSAGNVGAHALQAAAQRAEGAAGEGDAGSAAAAVEEMATAFAEARRRIEALLEGRT